jgi:hypothetical protein
MRWRLVVALDGITHTGDTRWPSIDTGPRARMKP